MKLWNWWKHRHVWSAWTVEERVYRLLGPYGRTENPIYFNVRRCTLSGCGYTQMERIRE